MTIEDIILKMNIIGEFELNKLYCEFMKTKKNGYKFENFLIDKKQMTKKQLRNIIKLKKKYESSNKYNKATATYELAECSTKNILSYISSIKNA